MVDRIVSTGELRSLCEEIHDYKTSFGIHCFCPTINKKPIPLRFPIPKSRKGLLKNTLRIIEPKIYLRLKNIEAETKFQNAYKRNV